mmetsp:Transcript_47961/g.126540  ORF Transcript_47961/g.126540 Transcript_47961/m.126540 type:complete len:251 (+) Transcript_47961:217-969(+)
MQRGRPAKMPAPRRPGEKQQRTTSAARPLRSPLVVPPPQQPRPVVVVVLDAGRLMQGVFGDLQGGGVRHQQHTAPSMLPQHATVPRRLSLRAAIHRSAGARLITRSLQQRRQRQQRCCWPGQWVAPRAATQAPPAAPQAAAVVMKALPQSLRRSHHGSQSLASQAETAIPDVFAAVVAPAANAAAAAATTVAGATGAAAAAASAAAAAAAGRCHCRGQRRCPGRRCCPPLPPTQRAAARSQWLRRKTARH